MMTIELELVELRARVARLESSVRRLENGGQKVAPPRPGEPLDQEQLLAWLKAEGLVVEPLPEMLAHAARWESLPEEEKEAHIRFMHSLVLDPPLSQIIIESRR
ncbi:MAG: hypothetical protein A2Z04_09850 [Chloroflexi bacterium RBG_16_57_9]|nr:MAG: hypothetical protein A2Z04_09850 [Chloroflexi bacterium RBG_16_57_9]